MTRRERSNVIPGVAIATALMPPVCTAGYGLATGQWAFFGGALLHNRQGGGQHLNAAAGHANAVGAGLGGHIHHVGLALGIEMGEGRGHARQHRSNEGGR